MSGIRKTGKINTLKKLNEEYQLGYSNAQIENMGVGQLRRIIFQVKIKQNLTIPKNAKLQRKD